MKNLGISGGWLTVNRYCNFRCAWCYATHTKFCKEDNMPLSLAYDLVDFLAGIGVKQINLIGGESTFWPHTFRVASRAKQLGMMAMLISNGWLLGFDRYRDKVAQSDISDINVALKGGSRKEYLEVTGFDGFEMVMKGLRETAVWKHIRVDTSIVLSKQALETFDQAVKAAFDNGASFMSIQMCGPMIYENAVDGCYMASPNQIIEKIVEKYEAILQYSGGRFSIEQSLPSCLWPPDFLQMLIDRRQVHHGCHFKVRNGILFDRWGRVLGCNHLYDYPLGQYGVDFVDQESFAEWWFNPQLTEFYGKMIAYPAQACITCPTYDLCGGGCPLHWFVYEPETTIGGGIGQSTRKEMHRAYSVAEVG